ncbi:hypothetical protein B0H13DRAFT_2306707 [Mycena leptocephala]|nr:hypothetical protein B0H13DRAFT_2306707 [Mycena leptocephala]
MPPDPASAVELQTDDISGIVRGAEKSRKRKPLTRAMGEEMKSSKNQGNKENESPGSEKKRCRWNALCDSVFIAQLIAEKAAGNQMDNAGWHQAAWTACSKALKDSEQKSGVAKKSADACQTRWGTLKAQYQLVKMLRNKSGWGWNDEDKHIVINPKSCKSFPLYDEVAQLVDGAVATGEGAFNPGQAVASAPSPDWPEYLPEEDQDDDDNFPTTSPSILSSRALKET